ncbi:four-helix bundle copper-binding protein [Pseudomonas sp. ALS1131]|nr:four-helix bundle copper-binding protein [Pseudomonas sp. ALS1131]TRO40980.1 four-helix bundle copper-binding protein [Pseudomonas sp. ALS1131]
MTDQYNYLDQITAYSSCANACEQCASACLREKDAGHYRCIELCRDCADLCRLTATLMLRDSPYVAVASQLCRIACLACAEECIQHTSQHCHECAHACQQCADDPLLETARDEQENTEGNRADARSA